MKFGDISRRSRVCLFIDGANMYSTCKNLKLDMDWAKVYEYFAKHFDLVHAYYYTAVSIEEGANKLQPLLDFLEYNGYTLRLKQMQEWTDERTGLVKRKGNMDLEMAVDIINASEWCSDVMLFTGDGDFTVVVDTIQARGCRVHAYSTTNPVPMIHDDLRRQVNFFHELNNMRERFSR